MASRLNRTSAPPTTPGKPWSSTSPVFGGDLVVNTFAQMGAEGAEAEKIMHSMLETPNGFTLMAADTPQGMGAPAGHQHQRELER